MDALELKVTFATREKEALADELAAQRRQNEELLSQQDRWDELRQATEQIQALANMASQADQEELKELRRIRDRSKVLEGENTALQRRVKDYETKIANNDKLAQTSRQSLVQARQRAEEWERRAKEAEGRLEVTQTSLDQVEQSHSQLDADYSLVKLQLEERDAEERLDKVWFCTRFISQASLLTSYLIGPAKQAPRPDRLSRRPGRAPASRSRQGQEISEPETERPPARGALPKRPDEPHARPARLARKHSVQPQPRRHPEGAVQRDDDGRTRGDAPTGVRARLDTRALAAGRSDHADVEGRAELESILPRAVADAEHGLRRAHARRRRLVAIDGATTDSARIRIVI